MWLFDIFKDRTRQVVINHLTRMEPRRNRNCVPAGALCSASA